MNEINDKPLCGYGCGQEAKFPPRKGRTKWCCDDDFRRCPYISKTKSKKMKKLWNDQNGIFSTEDFKMNLKKGVKKSWDEDPKRKIELSNWNKEKWNDKNSFFHSNERSEKISQIIKKCWSNKNSKFNSKEHRKRISKQVSLNLDKIRKKYPDFFKLEKARENKNNEIEITCKKCKKWFKPTKTQLLERLRCIKVKFRQNHSYFFCSEKCKKESIYYKRFIDPNIEHELHEYYHKVLKYTELNVKKYKDKIKDINLRSYEYQLDHKYSIHNGFENNVHPKIISHWKNLEILPGIENRNKLTKNSITLKELVKQIKEIEGEQWIHKYYMGNEKWINKKLS